jgi:hypothetical protein
LGLVEEDGLIEEQPTSNDAKILVNMVLMCAWEIHKTKPMAMELRLVATEV